MLSFKKQDSVFRKLQHEIKFIDNLYYSEISYEQDLTEDLTEEDKKKVEISNISNFKYCEYNVQYFLIHFQKILLSLDKSRSGSLKPNNYGSGRVQIRIWILIRNTAVHYATDCKKDSVF